LLLLVFVAVVGIAALTYQATGNGLTGFDQNSFGKCAGQ